MSNIAETIVIITEGTTQTTKINEVNLIKKYLQPLYLSDLNIEIYSFGTNIFQLYKQLDKEEDEFIDTYPSLRNCVIDKNDKNLEHDRDDISEIFLFFDLDAHDNTYPFDKRLKIISKMIQFFNNSTENGQLYISYPMVEAYKHPINTIFLVDIIEGYKKYVAKICDKRLEQLQKMTKDEWDNLLQQHMINANNFLHQTNDLIAHYEPQDFSQSTIYQTQLTNHIEPHNQVRVISPFVLFLLDYLGNPLLDEWKSVDE